MIELTNLTKAYGRGDQRTVVLDGVTFRVDAGEILAAFLATDPSVKNILLPLG